MTPLTAGCYEVNDGVNTPLTAGCYEVNDGVKLRYSVSLGRRVQNNLESVVDSVRNMALPEDMRQWTQQAFRDVETLSIAWVIARNKLEADPGSESLKEASKKAEKRLDDARAHLRRLQLSQLQSCNQGEGEQSD